MCHSVALSLALAGLLAGPLAAAPRPLPGEGWKGPRPAYRLRLAVQKPGVAGPTGALLYGVEAYPDAALGGVVYLTQAGALGVVPGKGPVARPLALLHGGELKARGPTGFE